MKSHANVVLFETAEELAVAAAERFVQFADAAQHTLGRFTVALAGGRTPRRVYELLTTEQFKDRVDWSRVYLFFGDERCVLPAHHESNYGMVEETLVSKVAIPPNNVFRMIGEGDPDENARSYEAELRTFFRDQPWPRFDVVLLGMGADGHTASLFPEADSLDDRSRWVVPTKNAEGQSRMTLTLPVFNQAAHIVVLVTGRGKAPALSEVLGGQSNSGLPASLIKPIGGSLEWLVDRDAASLLSSSQNRAPRRR